ncbi:DsbA family protein [Rhizobium sp. LjRoot98]|uniref:DsbA family protein n=1 Tax=Rhizobium sp. LjRoot98 TaxID=3342345 RepID=UPI003ECC5081
MPDIEFQYFFDPFCGWCYASAQALDGLTRVHGDRLRMMPSGLFVGPRPVSSIAEHAWRNDQRIAQLTGQPFTATYHNNVLLAPNGIFDSGPATKAMVALGQIDPALEPQFLHVAQTERYVRGIDTSKEAEVSVLASEVAVQAGFALDVATLLDRLKNDSDLHSTVQERIMSSVKRMTDLGIRGVPQLVVVIAGASHTIDGGSLYQGWAQLSLALQKLPGYN